MNDDSILNSIDMSKMKDIDKSITDHFSHQLYNLDEQVLSGLHSVRRISSFFHKCYQNYHQLYENQLKIINIEKKKLKI